MYLCARERVLLHNLWPDASSAPRPSFSRKLGVCVLEERGLMKEKIMGPQALSLEFSG